MSSLHVIITILVLFLSGIDIIEAKINVLALDFNQTTETDVLKNLSKECSEDMEIKSALDDETLSGEPKDKILQLCESGYAPDVIMISGHYASAWSGDRGSLTLVELEKLSCNPKCNNFFSKVKIGFFLACNNLIKTAKTNETAEQFMRRILEEHQDRFGPDNAIDAGIDMFEGENGDTNARRLSDIFSNYKAMMGFDGGAPLSGKEGGKSEIGFKNVFEKLKQKTKSKNICEGLGKILENDKEKSLDPLVKLLDSWKEEMNNVEAQGHGQDAAYLCQQCFDGSKINSEEVPRTIICDLLSEDNERITNAITEVLINPAWLDRLFNKMAQAIEIMCGDEIPCAKLNITKDQKNLLLEIARKKLKFYPSLVHKWSALKMILYLHKKNDSLVLEHSELFKKLLNDYMKSSQVINRDVFRQTILEAPLPIIEKNADELFLHYKTTEDRELKRDIYDCFAKTLGAYKGTIFLDNVHNYKFSSDNKYFYIVSFDGLIKVFEINEKDEKLKNLGGNIIKQNQVAWGVDISADGKYIAIASRDKTVKVYKTGRGLLSELGGEEIKANEDFRSIAISKDSKYVLATAFSDGIIKVLEIKDEKLKELGGDKIQYHKNDVLKVDISEDSGYVATASSDGTARVYKIRDGTLIELKGAKIQSKEGFYRVSISADNKYVSIGQFDGALKVFKISDENLVEIAEDEIKKHEILTNKDKSSDKYRIIISQETGTVQLFNANKDDGRLVEFGK